MCALGFSFASSGGMHVSCPEVSGTQNRASNDSSQVMSGEEQDTKYMRGYIQGFKEKLSGSSKSSNGPDVHIDQDVETFMSDSFKPKTDGCSVQMPSYTRGCIEGFSAASRYPFNNADSAGGSPFVFNNEAGTSMMLRVTQLERADLNLQVAPQVQASNIRFAPRLSENSKPSKGQDVYIDQDGETYTSDSFKLMTSEGLAQKPSFMRGGFEGGFASMWYVYSRMSAMVFMWRDSSS
jgi:hypothetical protein